MSPYLIGMPFTSAASVLLGSFVLYKKPSNRVNQTWFLACVAVASWSIAFCLLTQFRTEIRASIANSLCTLSAAWIAPLLTHFCIVITKSKQRALLIIGYINCIILSFLAFSPLLTYVRPNQLFAFYTAPGPLYGLHIINFYFYFFYDEYLLFKGLKRLPPENKNQIKLIIVAVTLGHIGGSFGFLPVFNLPVEPIAANFVWLYAAVISYAIVKHRLMDITVVLKKGIVYSFLIGLITLIYFITVYISSLFFQNFIGFKSVWTVLLIFAVVTFAFKPLERKVQRFVDTFIFKTGEEVLEKENLMLRQEVQKQEQMRAVATLAAGMAHEIKNPLTAIKTFTEHLPQKVNDPDFIGRFEKIVGSEVDKIDGIVRQLLEFSKPSPLQLEALDLSAVLNETLDLLNGEFIKRNIKTEKQLKTAVISGDRKQLKRAFLNIFLNSIDAMPSGGVLAVSINTSGRDIEIAISDTGTGIDIKDLAQIFDPFYTTKSTGTGLGLPITQGIVKEHKGTIKVKSEPRKGTTFTLLFKIAKAGTCPN